MKQETIARPSLPERFCAGFYSGRTAFWLLAIIAPVLFWVPITHDEIWHFWIGERMLQGARLYRDIIEVNPPLWFWMGLPLAASGLSARVAVVGFFIVAMAVALFLTPSRYRTLVLGTLVLLPLHDFGQREHFTLIATVPYVFLMARRSSEKSVRRPFLIGLFAGFGLALKPYFVIVPIALELTIRRHVRPETVALAICAAAYAAAVLLLAPEYLNSVVPLVRRAYGAFGGGPGVILTLFSFAFAIAGVALRPRNTNHTSRALLIAALAFLPAVLIQAKGWSYQSIPARGFLFLAIANELIRYRGKPLPDALLFGAALTCFMPLGVYRNVLAPEVERHLVGIHPGSSIVVLANNPSVAWPLVYDRQLVWELPEMSTWQVQALHDSPDLEPVAKRLAERGLAKHPDLLLIDLDPRYARETTALLPPHYLDGYQLRLRTTRFASYARRGYEVPK